MPDNMEIPEVTGVSNMNTQGTTSVSMPTSKPKKNVNDWVRDKLLSADVNKTTVGVESARITPELMLATSKKLLKLNRREVEPDAKDSLEFQRVYGPSDYFAEHVLRDANRLGRQLLWKATNKGNVDFMPVGALDQHVSDVFNASKAANMIDGSSPLETVEASFKVSRIGEGGIGSVDSAPTEMRLVQPSFLGYIDPVRSVECAVAEHQVKVKEGWKGIAEVTEADLVLCLVDGKPEYRHPERTVSYDYEGPVYFFRGDAGLRWEGCKVTPEHRIPVFGDDETYKVFTAEEIYRWFTDDSYNPDETGYYLAEDPLDREFLFGGLKNADNLNSGFDFDVSKMIEKQDFKGKVYCLTVPGGLFYTRYPGGVGHWTGNSLRVGLDAYLSKHCKRGTDGKLYQKFINARTGKEELVDSVTAAKSVVTTPDMMKAKTDHIYAVGGKTGVRIVKKADVDYYLPRMDDAFTTASNMVTGLSGVKELRLLMGCLHPLTNVITYDKKNMATMSEVKSVNASSGSISGLADAGLSSLHQISTTVSKFPLNRAWFKKVVLYSGRALVTSRDHRWPVLKGDKLVLVTAEKLKEGDKVLRSTFKDVPNRRTFINGILITRNIATFLGCAVRSLSNPDEDKLTIQYQPQHKAAIMAAVERLGIKKDFKFYQTSYKLTMSIRSGWFYDWLKEHIGVKDSERRIPSEILSAYMDVVAAFMDGYTADETLVGMDSLEYVWILDIPNTMVRDGLSYLLARMRTDTLYRDSYEGNGKGQLALKLVELKEGYGDCIVDEVKDVQPVPNAAIMVDIDINDNMYAVANGIITHNSKYPQQAVSIEGREPPLVRNLDGQSGKDIHSIIGKYLGARYASKPGTVTAVRQDRIDMLYDDGTKGSIAMYRNFPMNAKGYLDNKPQVKAGMHINKGDLLASSNYTDDKGVAATGTNLRVGWMSWKGGTYEDAIVLSESAAKKLTSTTMYSQDLDLDKTIALGKKNYMTWKPGEYTKEQLSVLDDDGIVKPGMILQKGDPMVLAIQTEEPSPGTMGKRILTDISETWEHDHPGVVTDVLRTKKGVKVIATVTAPVEVGDKISGLYGNKGVVSQVIPDASMPVDKDGNPLEMLLSPLGLISRTNPNQLTEALLGKVAKKTGKYETIPAFYEGSIRDLVDTRLKQAHLNAEDDFFDPETGRKIPGITNGYAYIHKLKHLAESKLSARGTGEYSSDDTPAGSGESGSKRYGGLEISAMVGHGAFDNLLDLKLIRGQSNADFWRSIRTGGIPTIPGEPLVQRKFFAYLQGAGVNVRKTPKGISVFPLSSSDVKEMTGPRELKTKDTYETKNFRPIDGGLFGQDVFGMNGDRWGYIQLDEPMPNPVMAEPLAKLLRISDKDFVKLASGAGEINGMSGGKALKDKLATYDLEKEAKLAQQEFKEAPASKKDAALKRYVAIENMRRQGLNPAEYMLDRIPVIPPTFRPVTSHKGLTMVADANYLYAQLLDARDDLRDAKDLPQEYQDKARQSIYRSWQELNGMYDPEDVKLRNKNVGGLLQWALGKGSPKFSGFQRKVLGASVDTVGRGAIVPDSKITIDEIGIPVRMAFGIMAPFVERALVKRGYTPIDAMKMVKKQTPQAFDVLKEVVATHPVQMNRAPSLHKYNILAFKPKLVQGNAIHIHPSVCPGFNADFDGDTVNVHVPVSDNAIRESMDRMRPSRNLIALSNHKIMNKPEKEYMQGLYIATRMGQAPNGRARIFRTLDEAREARRQGEIDVDTPIQILESSTK